MLDILKNIDSIINSFLVGLGIYGPLLGCFLILIESMVPILPLFVFITINFLAFGTVIGYLISLFFTILGCLLSFFLCRKKVQGWFNNKISQNEKVKKLMKIIDNIKLEQLATIIAVPFTPAFIINIAAGLSNTSFKKYFTALVIGKSIMVFFWGVIGTSLIQSLTNPIVFIKVVILLLIAFIISKIISKKFNFD